MAGEQRTVQSGEFEPKSFVREGQAGWLKAEHLRFATARQNLSGTDEANTHLQDYMLCRSVRPGSGAPGWVNFQWGKKKKL